MEYKRIILKLNRKLIDKVVKHYHFFEQDMEKLQALYQVMLPLVRAEAFYIWNPVVDVTKQAEAGRDATLQEAAIRDVKIKAAAVNEDTRALVFLSLGKGIDELQDLYVETKCLQEAYMIECIGLELLTEVYEEFVKHVQMETHKWAKKMDFLGDNYPIEELPDLYAQVFTEPGLISYSEHFVLNPKKSVVFFLPMSEEKTTVNPCHVCSQCKNAECMFRQELTDNIDNGNTRIESKDSKTVSQMRRPNSTYSYGYQRFFGSQESQDKKGI